MGPPGDERLGRQAWESAVDELRDEGRAELPDRAGPMQRGELANRLYGSIVWPKALGRPDAVDAAAGFEVTSACLIEKHDSPGGPVLAEVFEAVLVVEEPSDTEEYVVRISTGYVLSKDGPTTLRATFAGTPWVGPRRPRLEPANGFAVRMSAGGPVQAPAFRLYADHPSYADDGPVPIG